MKWIFHLLPPPRFRKNSNFSQATALFWIVVCVGLMSYTQWHNLLARSWVICTFWQKIKWLVYDDDDDDDDDFIFWKRGRCLDIWVVTEAKSRTWGGKTNWKTTTMVADNSPYFFSSSPSQFLQRCWWWGGKPESRNSILRRNVLKRRLDNMAPVTSSRESDAKT